MPSYSASSRQRQEVACSHIFWYSTVPPLSPHQDREAAFPTEGRERQKVMQKARKLAGGTAIKRKFVVEDHFDDCGTDLSGLGPDIALFAADVIVDTLPVEAAPDSFAHDLSVWWLRGSEYEELDSEQRPPHARITNSAHEMVEILAAMPLGDDIVELAGGQNRCLHPRPASFSKWRILRNRRILGPQRPIIRAKNNMSV